MYSVLLVNTWSWFVVCYSSTRGSLFHQARPPTGKRDFIKAKPGSPVFYILLVLIFFKIGNIPLSRISYERKLGLSNNLQPIKSLRSNKSNNGTYYRRYIMFIPTWLEAHIVTNVPVLGQAVSLFSPGQIGDVISH